MKYLIFFLTITNLCLSQTKSFDEAYKKSNISKVLMESDCENVKRFADEDIKNENTFLFLQGGIAPIIYSTDKNFENNYNLYFYDQGCIGSECVENYNYKVFDLYKTFGKNWIKTIRKDVLGFKSWKKKINFK